MIQIRKATERDSKSLAELNQAFNGVNRTSDQIRRVLQTSAATETVLVAEESGAVVGFACLQTLHSICYDSPWTEITELYVKQTHRSSGVGKALVRDAIRQAQESGASEILLRTNVKNEAAQSLFTRFGLEPAPELVFHKRVGMGTTRL
jgi:ribosomal protein S18 acetylase RimI-like enzyme